MKSPWVDPKKFIIIISAKYMHGQNQGIQVRVTDQLQAIVPFWSIKIPAGVYCLLELWTGALVGLNITVVNFLDGKSDHL